MTIHIYTAEHQPATDFWDSNIDPPIHVRHDPRMQIECRSCGRIRYARNMVVQVYYDDIRYFCGAGGCKENKK
jgi:hypothetical protein